MFPSLKILFLCLSVFVFSPAEAQDSGKIILDIQEESRPYNLQEEYDKYWQDVDFFDKKYSGTKIEEDFVYDVIERHPEYAQESSSLRERFLRNTIKIKRLYNRLKAQAQEFILKQNIPLVAADNQYEFGEDEVYRPAKDDGKALVIQDFKKIIAYSNNPKEQEAAAAKKAHDAGILDSAQKMEMMKQALLKRDWKTLFTYGLFDGKASLEDNRGIGEWSQSKGGTKARIVNSLKVINKQEKINGAIQVYLEEGDFVLSQKYKDYEPIQVQLSAKNNIDDIEFNMPLPQRFFVGKDSLAGYVGLITIPFSARIQDVEKSFSLSVNIKADVCHNTQCQRVFLQPYIEILAGTENESESSIASFLRLISPYYPHKKQDDLKIVSVQAENSSKEEQILRLELETKTSPSRVEAFIEGKYGTEFASPLIRIDGHHVIVKFRSLKKGADYIGQSIDFVVATSSKTVLRQKMVVEPLSVFNTETSRLNFLIIWFAYLGGLLLNLMPCVFPVLSLKILSFTRFGAIKTDRIRRDFIYNILGILSSFVIIIGTLVCLKLLGYSLGWGMQFQSILFISFMTFVITLFMAQIMGLIHLKMPDFISKLSSKSERGEKTEQFLNGMFLVLLSTPCTAPYLGTALGFALAGSVVDIIIVVGVTGLGLATPYILVALVPDLAYYIPKPGKWMSWFNFAIFIMLSLTLCWLVSLLVAQGGSDILWHYSLFIPSIWLVLYIRKILIEELERQENDPQVFLTISRWFNHLTLIVILALIAWGMYDARAKVLQKELSESPSISEKINQRQINELIRNGNIVLLKIGANWCLTCHYNDAMVLEAPFVEDMYKQYNIVPIELDWSKYDADILAFMEKYGRKGLPFYVLFSARTPDGMVLPEILNEREFEEIIKNQIY